VPSTFQSKTQTLVAVRDSLQQTLIKCIQVCGLSHPLLYEKNVIKI